MPRPTANPLPRADHSVQLRPAGMLLDREPKRHTSRPAAAARRVDPQEAARALDRVHVSARNFYVTTRCLQVITGTSEPNEDGTEPRDSLTAAYEALLVAQAGAEQAQAELDAATQAGTQT